MEREAARERMSEGGKVGQITHPSRGAAKFNLGTLTLCPLLAKSGHKRLNGWLVKYNGAGTEREPGDTDGQRRYQGVRAGRAEPAVCGIIDPSAASNRPCPRPRVGLALTRSRVGGRGGTIVEGESGHGGDVVEA